MTGTLLYAPDRTRATAEPGLVIGSARALKALHYVIVVVLGRHHQRC